MGTWMRLVFSVNSACHDLFLHAHGVRAVSRRLPWGGARKAVLHPKLLTHRPHGLKSACSKHCDGAAVVHRRVLTAASDHQLKCKN